MMNDSAARFEFRTFAQSFGPIEDNIRRRSPCAAIDESAETYLVTAGMDEHNVKARGGALEAKTMVDRRQRLEQWKPAFQQPFPIAAATLRDTIFPLLEITDAKLDRDQYSLAELIDEIARPHPVLHVAHVFKRRFRFTIASCSTELDEVLVNGAAIRSVAIEAEDQVAVSRAVAEVGLADYDNVNYVLAIQRVLGLRPPPRDAWYAG